MHASQSPGYITGNQQLAAASHDFGRTVRKQPRAIACPSSAQEVVEVIRDACRTGVPLTFQGAGHSQSGQSLSNNGILVDMKGLDRIGDVRDGEVTVEGGARWREVVDSVGAQGYLPPALTTHLTVTVGGTLSVGGLSITSHRYGAQVDNVTELEVVTGAGDLLRCSPEKNAELFNHARCGMGQFGAITGARIRLRRPLPRVRTYTLLYDNIGPMMQDMEMLVRDQRFQYIDGWCQPVVRDMWQLVSGHMYAHRIFVVYLGVEWDEAPPDQAEMLADLQHTHLAGWSDDTTLGFAMRMETRHLSPGPRALDWKAETFRKRTNARGKGWFNDWDQSHPCTEGLLPWDTFPQFMMEVVSELPAPVARSARIMLGPFQGQRFSSPILARPEGELLMGYGILLEAPQREMDEILPILAGESRRIIEAGGKRYLSGWVDFDDQGWREHYGDLWPGMLKAKRRFDPHGILNPDGMPLHP